MRWTSTATRRLRWVHARAAILDADGTTLRPSSSLAAIHRQPASSRGMPTILPSTTILLLHTCNGHDTSERGP